MTSHLSVVFEDNNLIEQLSAFLSKAMRATYAGDGVAVVPYRPKFIELDYQEGDWYYRDSYAGYSQSWGQEVIWYKNEPLWTQIYGGGMLNLENISKEFCDETFKFLKTALSLKHNHFQPRGPNDYQQDDWIYKCEWHGDIRQFYGQEEIYYRNKLIFTHNFRGGFFIN